MNTTHAKSPRAQLSTFRILLNAILRADWAYRQKQHVKGLSNERLEDVGLTRDQANAAFYRQWSSRPADQDRLIISTRVWQ